MLVLSRNLVVVPAEQRGGHLPIIGWDSRVSIDSVVADHEEQNHPAILLGNTHTNEAWVSDNPDDAQYVTVDAEGDYDYVAIARHNFGSAGIIVSIEGDAGAGFFELIGETLLADDKPVLFRFELTTLDAIRIKLQPDGEAPSAAVLFAGELLVMQRGVKAGHTPLPYGRQRDILTGRSESGEYLGRIQSGGHLRSRADFGLLDPDFYREEVDAFVEYGGPFFFAWAPDAYPDEVGFAWCTTDPVPVASHLAGFIDLSLDMEGIDL